MKKQLKKKRKLYKSRNENLETLATYKKVRSQIQRQIRKARWDHINAAVSNDDGGEYKGFWSYVRSFKCDNTGIAVLMKDGETATAPVEKAELLNKQFSSVFTSEDTDSVPKITQKKYTNIGRIDVTVDGVMQGSYAVIKSHKSDK